MEIERNNVAPINKLPPSVENRNDRQNIKSKPL